LAFLLTVLVGLSTCLVAAAVLAPSLLGGLTPGSVLIGGSLVLVGSLTGLWMIHRRRDRSLW
jgi:hypothetical protein